MRLRRTRSAPPLDRRHRIGGLTAVARAVRAAQSLAGPPLCCPPGPRHRVAGVEPRPCPVSNGSDSAATRRRSGLLRDWRQSIVARGGLQTSTAPSGDGDGAAGDVVGLARRQPAVRVHPWDPRHARDLIDFYLSNSEALAEKGARARASVPALHDNDAIAGKYKALYGRLAG